MPNATDAATNSTVGNSTASNGTVGAAAAPPPAGGRGIAQQAIDGTLNGLDVAARFAGDIVRSVVPAEIIDRIPFLIVDVIGVAV